MLNIIDSWKSAKINLSETKIIASPCTISKISIRLREAFAAPL